MESLEAHRAAMRRSAPSCGRDKAEEENREGRSDGEREKLN